MTAGKRLVAVFSIIAFAMLPLTPAMIALTPIVPPGISLLTMPAAAAVLGLEVVMSLAALVLAARGALRPSPLLRPMLALLGAMLVAAVLGLDPRAGLLLALAEGMVIMWHLGIWNVVEARWARVGMLTAMLGAGVLASLLAIVMVVLRRPAALYTYVLGRATGTFIVPGELAGYLLFVLACAAGVLSAARSRALRALAAVAIVTGLIALYLSYSRAGWLGLVTGAAFVVVIWQRSKRARAIVLGGVVLVAMALPFFQGHHNETDNFTRLPIWEASLRIIALFPLTGVGPGAFRLAYDQLHPPGGLAAAFHAHDVLLTVAAETGVVGLAAFVWLWVSFGRELGRRIASASPRARALGSALAAGFVATGAQGLLDTVTVVEIGCWIPFMALALGAAEHGVEEA